MTQQVNLFQPIFRKQEQVLSARALLQVCLVVAVGCAGLYGYAYRQVGMLEQQLVAREAQRTRAVSRLEQAARELPPPAQSEALEARIRQLSTERDVSLRLAQALSSPDFANRSGFSRQLEGIVGPWEQGLVLTQIGLSGGGARIALSGRSLAPHLVPRYLQRLSDEAVLTGIAFETFQLSRARDGQSVDFVLRTGPEAGAQ